MYIGVLILQADALKGRSYMKIKNISALILSASLALTMSGCALFGGGDDAPDETRPMNADEYESRISELESQVESLKAETVVQIGFRDKTDYILGKDNPAVSEAAALKEEAMADLPATITIKGTEYSTRLTSLTLNNMGLNDDDIKDLKYMVNLTELHMYQNHVTDITPLKGLTSLKTLSLFNNDITDISPLAGLIGLETLYLRGNNISDISALDGLHNVQTLDISENNIKDITPLSELRNVKLLRINDNDISDISALSGLKSMDRLHMQNNSISDITPLTAMADLTEVYLENNNVSDVEPLMSLTSLGWIKLGYNPVTNFTPITHLTQLKKLYIEGINLPEDELQSLQDKLPDTTLVTK